MASLLSMVLKSGTLAASVLINMHLRPDFVTIVFEENSWFKTNYAYLLQSCVVLKLWGWAAKRLRAPQVGPESHFGQIWQRFSFLISEALCWNLHATKMDSIWSLSYLKIFISLFYTSCLHFDKINPFVFCSGVFFINIDGNAEIVSCKGENNLNKSLIKTAGGCNNSIFFHL